MSVEVCNLKEDTHGNDFSNNHNIMLVVIMLCLIGPNL